MHSDLPNICSTYTPLLSWSSVFSLLMENELYLPTVYACLCTGSWGLLKWVTPGICKREYTLANKLLKSKKESNTSNRIFPSRSLSHMAADYAKPQIVILPSSSNHRPQPWDDGHYVNPCIWDFYVITEEAVCITVHLITVPFKRLSHWGGMVVVSTWFSAFKEKKGFKAFPKIKCISNKKLKRWWAGWPTRTKKPVKSKTIVGHFK